MVWRLLIAFPDITGGIRPQEKKPEQSKIVSMMRKRKDKL